MGPGQRDLPHRWSHVRHHPHGSRPRVRSPQGRVAGGGRQQGVRGAISRSVWPSQGGRPNLGSKKKIKESCGVGGTRADGWCATSASRRDDKKKKKENFLGRKPFFQKKKKKKKKKS